MSSVSGARAQRAWRPPEKEKAARGVKTAAAYEKNGRHNHTSVVRYPATRRLPAYGRHLLAMRERGEAPAGLVIVAVDLWIQDQLPPTHCIVIPRDLPPPFIDFRILAGLDICIVHDTARSERARELAKPILAARPFWLAIADIEQRVAATVLENGVIGWQPWRAWEWARFDGEQPLNLPWRT